MKFLYRESNRSLVKHPIHPFPPAPAAIDEFQTLSADDIQNVLMSASTKSCALDPLPTHVVKEFLPELLQYITDMCNSLNELYLSVRAMRSLRRG